MDHLYNIALETTDNSILIDWDTAIGWMTTYAAELNAANSIALIPKDNIELPVVSVQLGDNKRWIIFRRMFGILGTDNQVPIYCIGWQKTIHNENVKQLLWIYPNGTIESGEQPTMWKLFL